MPQKRKSIARHLLESTYRSDRHDKRVRSQGSGDHPVMPTGLSLEAAAVWEEIVPGLIARYIVTAADAIGLATLCSIVVAVRQGPVSARMAAELRSWLRAYGLTPDAPLRIDPPLPPKKPGPMDKYLQGRN